MNKKIPLMIKVISLLLLVGALTMVVIGISSLFNFQLSPSLPTINTLSSILTLVIGIVGAFTAVYLWKGKNWARIIMIIFCFVGIVESVLNMTVITNSLVQGVLSNLILSIINLLLALYFIFTKQAKDFFKS